MPIVRQHQWSGWFSRILWNAAPYTHTLEEFLENNDLFFQFWHVLRVPLACLSLTWRYVEHRVLRNVVWDVEGHRHEAKLRAANKWSHPVRTVTVPSESWCLCFVNTSTVSNRKAFKSCCLNVLLWRLLLKCTGTALPETR